MYTLYVTTFAKDGKFFPVLKSLNKIVTFDMVIICSVLNLSPNEVYIRLNEQDEIIIIERS